MVLAQVALHLELEELAPKPQAEMLEPAAEPQPELAFKLSAKMMEAADELALTRIPDKRGEGEHLLDILRTAFTLPELGTRQRDLGQTRTPSHVIHSVAKLRYAGIKIRWIEADSFLTVKFRRGLIEMPTVTIDDFMSSFFANCMVYELCHKNSTTYFTSYFMLLDCLVNSQRDVQYLCDQNIIHNFFGTEAEIFAFISNLAKDVTLDIDSCHLAELFNDVNDYYQYSWHVQWARFKYAYLSVAGASVLLVLTVLQALYGMLSYYKGN
ncbi:hypothetical protein Nepgr_028171 [Nepenthes gracilis]|uniref:Uncharacterized protein n=1 Tax=Nepenthes gracilis TaxID=150966 RepID=A0AAD3TA56_NEPGR|nr:hypothetical protein Nepgr_028171 [Nepenthes gracilis]